MDPAGNRVERVGHRGAPREQKENTLPSFVRALELGADAIELDVHLTADGVVVVHHDDAARGRAIATTLWSELKDVDLGDGAHIPRLQDVLETVADRATVYIELKGCGVESAAILTARQWGRRFALHSFDHAAVERVAAAAPDIPRGVLLDRGTPRAAQAMQSAIERTGARDVWPHWSLVDEPFMKAARQLAARVIAWTVNSEGTARALRDLGAAALCTDDLTVLAKL
jgi:glycerophosphoryl diester phosphodiesterase